MTIDIDPAVFEEADPIYAIAEEVFAAMVDGEAGLLTVWDRPVPELSDPIHAWVDVHGLAPGRVLLSTERATAEKLARALLMMSPDEEVGDSDLVDAFGEVANVVGGNVKALVPDPGVLGLPEVTRERPVTAPESLVYELSLDWRGRLLVIGLWHLT